MQPIHLNHWPRLVHASSTIAVDTLSLPDYLSPTASYIFAVGTPWKWTILILFSLKGTASPDIAFYFIRVYKLKSVLSVRQLLASKFVYFVVH
jgi:hypothetical protein